MTIFEEIQNTQSEITEFENQIAVIHNEGRDQAMVRQTEEIQKEKRQRIRQEPDYLKDTRRELASERKRLTQYRARYQKAMAKKRKKTLVTAERQQQEARLRFQSRASAAYQVFI